MEQKYNELINVQLLINYLWLSAGILLFITLSFCLTEIMLYPEECITDIFTMVLCLGILIILNGVIVKNCYQDRNIVVINNTMINLNK